MDSIYDINRQVMNLWEKWANALQEDDNQLLIPFLYPPEMKRDALLFIGMNPSFVPSAYKRILRNTRYSDTDFEAFYLWRNRAKFDIKKCQDIEKEMRDKYPFFNKFKEIAKEASTEYEYVDLFFNRETSQKQFENKILDNKELTDFITRQLELSEYLIRYVRPIVIVVANALASNVFENKLGGKLSLTWDERCGHHTAMVDTKNVPILFASMLTGQRAMDRGSYKRLKWHIKKALCASTGFGSKTIGR